MEEVKIALTSINTTAISSVLRSGRRQQQRDWDHQPLLSASADISPVSGSGNWELSLSMSHQRACLRTAVDVSALPKALTLVEK